MCSEVQRSLRILIRLPCWRVTCYCVILENGCTTEWKGVSRSYLLCTLGIIYSIEGRSISKMAEDAHYISGSSDVTAHLYWESPPHTHKVFATVWQRPFCRLICHNIKTATCQGQYLKRPRAEGCYLAYQPPFYAIYYISGGSDVTVRPPPVTATVGQRPFCRLICHISNLPTIHKLLWWHHNHVIHTVCA